MMKTRVLVVSLLACCLASVDGRAQITERDRPDAWKGLVLGGRFMDRFLPVPIQAELTEETWGADGVRPRDVTNGIEDREWSYWGGNAILGPDGRRHLYVCRWAESSRRGHGEWPRSIVVHAVSDSPLGPYRVAETVGSGHNPEAFQLKDGRCVIYVIDGYYIGDSVDGPWERRQFDFQPRDRRIIDGLSNLTFAQREDGSYLMVCRGGGVWLSKTGLSPYQQVTSERVYPPVRGRFEDPLVWRTNIQYHLIVNDWYGRIAYYLRSKDGIHWKVDPGEAYLPGIDRYENGANVDWFKYERIKVLQDKHGRATQAHFAVIDVLKGDDKGSDNHSSKHICIPLTVGRLLTILDEQPIDAETKSIRVKLAAEPGFAPHADVDLESLRFGASEEVNFGRGCRVQKTEAAGDDLILTFEGVGNGITKDNFAAKLLGKTTAGQLLFGYARLPWLDYLEPALSARKPTVAQTDDGFQIAVEIQNFGQVASERTKVTVEVSTDGETVGVATGVVDALAPFQKAVVSLPCEATFEKEISYRMKVVIAPDSERPEVFQTDGHSGPPSESAPGS